MAGHRGYLSDAHRRFTEAELESYYLQAEPRLTVMALAEAAGALGDLENLVAENIELKN